MCCMIDKKSNNQWRIVDRRRRRRAYRTSERRMRQTQRSRPWAISTSVRRRAVALSSPSTASRASFSSVSAAVNPSSVNSPSSSWRRLEPSSQCSRCRRYQMFLYSTCSCSPRCSPNNCWWANRIHIFNDLKHIFRMAPLLPVVAENSRNCCWIYLNFLPTYMGNTLCLFYAFSSSSNTLMMQFWSS